MADAEDIQPLVCDNGTGMVKVHFFVLIKGYQLQFFLPQMLWTYLDVLWII